MNNGLSALPSVPSKQYRTVSSSSVRIVLFTGCIVISPSPRGGNFPRERHSADFELNILLYGRQHFYQGSALYDLEENDVVLVNPNVGHASYCDPEGTIAFVLHFPVSALKPFTHKGSRLTIPFCLSDAVSRNTPVYRKIRMYAAQILYYLNQNDVFAPFMAKASLQLLIGTLCREFAAEDDNAVQQTDEVTQKIILTVLDYLDDHYSEKISLQDIADLTGYNRTYLSTLFHQCLGIRFYDYLMHLRLQKAIRDLLTTDRSLTEIALNNGFSDLKSFNTRFREMLMILPSEYRSRIQESTISPEYYDIQSIPADDPLIEKKLQEFMFLQ